MLALRVVLRQVARVSALVESLQVTTDIVPAQRDSTVNERMEAIIAYIVSRVEPALRNGLAEALSYNTDGDYIVYLSSAGRIVLVLPERIRYYVVTGDVRPVHLA